MTATKVESSIGIDNPAVVHFLATVLDKKEFTMFTLEMGDAGLSGFSLDDSHTLFCEFEIPGALLMAFTKQRWGPLTLMTEDLEAVIGPASTRFADQGSELMMEVVQGGLRLKFSVPRALTRTKLMPDHPDDRQRRLPLGGLTEGAEATPTDSRLLSLAGATYGKEGPVRVSIHDGRLELGPSPNDSLTFDVNSKGSATTTILDRAFRVVNAYVQARDPPQLTFRAVDDGVLSFEAVYPFGARVRYVVTRVAEED